jgi:D-xylulose reductase
MASSNRSVVFLEARQVIVEDRPVPGIRDDEVLVEVISTGICGSDVHNYCDPKTHKGLVLGHESSGRISKIGKNVKGRSVGEKVAIEPGFVCKK